LGIQHQEDEKCIQIQVNVDDSTPEVLGFLIQMLFEEKLVLDAWFIPIQMKKFRPAVMLCVLALKERLEVISEMIFKHCSAIGLRFFEVDRVKLQRKMEYVEVFGEKVGVKVAFDDGGKVVNRAPEYEDCARVARLRGVGIKEVLERVTLILGNLIICLFIYSFIIF
jgi:uncharacterized protein (DUF111 family)